MSSFSDITNVTLAGSAAAKDVIKPVGPNAKGTGVTADPAVSDGLAYSSGIRSAQASLITKLKQVNRAINVIQSLEGESSALNNMLEKIEAMIKQGGESLIEDENNPARMSLKGLVEALMKGINAPVYADVSNYADKQQVLAYIGKGFSIDVLEGGIVFDISKMLEDVYKRNEEQERQDGKREDYRRAMGLVKGTLESLMESVSADVNKAAGLTYILKDIKEARCLSTNMIEKIRQESSMLSRSYGDIDPKSAMKLLIS
ncbi:MAG: hypothetical protein K9M75_13055 [Phycisphaerae bacterium]|nr:hypothetical protein [Phycisphaerae bacterium]